MPKTNENRPTNYKRELDVNSYRTTPTEGRQTLGGTQFNQTAVNGGNPYIPAMNPAEGGKKTLGGTKTPPAWVYHASDEDAKAAKEAKVIEDAKEAKVIEDAKEANEANDKASKFADEKVQSMITDPTGYLEANKLEQAYTPGVIQEDEEILDVNGNAIADPGNLSSAQAQQQASLQAAAGVNVGAIGTRQVAQQSALDAAGNVIVGDIDVQKAAAQASLDVAANVNVGEIDVAAIQQQQAIEAAAAVQARQFSASLIEPTDLTKAVDEIAKLEPMKAASMAKEMDSLLEGMEAGNVPLWARPAVTQVEQMLAGRGISASSIGRDALFNAIIQSALPIAQQDATFKQDSYKTTYNAKVQGVLSDVNMEFASKQFNATSTNQTNQFRSQLQSQVDLQNAARQDAMSQFNSTMRFNVGQINAGAQNQANLTLAQLRTTADLQNAGRQDAMAQFNTQTQAQSNQFNASAANQAALAQAQLQTNADLQNAGRQDAMSQFNTQTQAQSDQFNASATNQANLTQAQLQTNADLQNASRQDAMTQADAQIKAQVEQFNASQVNSMTTANAQLQAQRSQFNANMATQLEQSNVSWRRQVNAQNTAGANAVNQANVQNAFNLSNQALTFLWQEQRDEAHWDFQATEAEKDRKNQLEATLLASEVAMGGEIGNTIERLLNGSNFITSFLDSIGG